MKNKKKLALALITVMSLSALSLSVFADSVTIGGIPKPTVQETQNDQQCESEEKTTNGATDNKDTDSETGDKIKKPRGHGKHIDEQIAEPENAIGEDAAESKALNDAGVTEDQAGRVMSHLSQLDDGTIVYRVDFIYSDQHYFYQINATSGEIVEKNNNAVTEDRKAGTGKGHGRHGEEQITEPENAIGNDAAKSKALDDAGITEDQAGRVMSHLSQLDDGTVVYKVNFIFNSQRYSYQINATSGEIVGKNTNSDTEDKKTESRGHGKHFEEINDSSTDSSSETTATAA